MKLGSIPSLVALLALALAGCPAGGESQPAGAAPKELEIAYVTWADAVATSHVAKALLEELGYEVKLTAVQAGIMWQAVADGKADALVAGWLPTLHGEYLERAGDAVRDLGPNLVGTQLGLAVPAYVDVTSIAELADPAVAEKLDGQIVGIDAGAGLMAQTTEAIERYGLSGLELVNSSGPAMTAALGDAIEDQRWIVVTAWRPHWKFSRWDLRFLDDPEGVYGTAEEIHTVVRAGLAGERPDAERLLDRFQWDPADVEQVMAWNTEDGADPDETARRWVAANRERVDAWLAP